ncbi:unnamed protein product [Didymodactylos carnosus]|uniref:Uncharacterized protein n=1 Tax=Didymodactylos carnosus TaxID=1234261 RepID=A0A8S2CQ39_9BILA|nr:unnamed protein product [Didymodactylos carnosus]CAF3492331.1 unnamed protein product [Didymodactylos carnosus]
MSSRLVRKIQNKNDNDIVKLLEKVGLNNQNENTTSVDDANSDETDYNNQVITRKNPFELFDAEEEDNADKQQTPNEEEEVKTVQLKPKRKRKIKKKPNQHNEDSNQFDDFLNSEIATTKTEDQNSEVQNVSRLNEILSVDSRLLNSLNEMKKRFGREIVQQIERDTNQPSAATTAANLQSLQQSFHPLFSITRGECRLDYQVQENRSFFISLFKNMIYIGERGCPRTALEYAKVILRQVLMDYKSP